MRDKLSKVGSKKFTAFGLLITIVTISLTVYLVNQMQDFRGLASSPDKIETEQGVLSGAVEKLGDSLASGGQYVKFGTSGTASPTPNPTSPPSSSNAIYGPGLNIDSKNNFRIGDGGPGSERTLSHRFRASTTSKLQSVSWELRLGDGYSAGDRGSLKISIQTDDETANHFPSGQILDSYIYNPPGTGGNVRQNFPNPPTLTKSQIYHIVFENIHSDPVNNYVSANEIFTFKTYNPRQPNPDFSGDYAILYRTGDVWAYQPNDTPQMDLAYADGTHDGQAYSQANWEQTANSSDPEQIGRIENQRMAREIFTVQGGDKIVISAYIRVAQEYGSGDLTIALKNNSGTILGQDSVAASQISDYAAEPHWYDDPRTARPTAGDWVSITFNSPLTLKNGNSYQLVMSAPSGTRYAMVPIKYRGWDDVYHLSYAFREGKAQLSRDGGINWEDNYNFQPYNNYQFYFTLQ